MSINVSVPGSSIVVCKNILKDHAIHAPNRACYWRRNNVRRRIIAQVKRCVVFDHASVDYRLSKNRGALIPSRKGSLGRPAVPPRYNSDCGHNQWVIPAAYNLSFFIC